MRDIREAKDPVLRGAPAAMQRAAEAARQLAIQTNTELIVMEDGKLMRLTPKELLRRFPPSEPLAGNSPVSEAQPIAPTADSIEDSASEDRAG